MTLSTSRTHKSSASVPPPPPPLADSPVQDAPVVEASAQHQEPQPPLPPPTQVMTGKRKSDDAPGDMGSKRMKESKPQADVASVATVEEGSTSETTRPHETPAQFGQRHKELFRTIRIVGGPKTKVVPGENGAKAKKESIDVPPDGDLFPDQKDSRSAYLKLTAWPEGKSVEATDPTADHPVVRHVSGDNAATQYISTAKDLEAVAKVTIYDFSGEGGQGKMRSPRFWGPALKIGVDKLPEKSAVYDVSREHESADKLWAEGGDPSGNKDEIRGMAKRDGEVLLSGEIPGTAVTEVVTVPKLMDYMVENKPGFAKEVGEKIMKDGKVSNPRDRAIFEQTKPETQKAILAAVKKDEPDNPFADFDLSELSD